MAQAAQASSAVGMFRISRIRRLKVPVVDFSKNRYERRFNMNDEDRVRLANWNLASIVLTFVPIAYMMQINYRTSANPQRILNSLDPMGAEICHHDTRIFEA